MTTTPKPINTTCTSPLIIGNTYLDTWGRPAIIRGYVRVGTARGGSEDDPTRVYCSNRHYDINTGIATDGARLVNLEPADEFKFWTNQLALIRSSNPPHKLKLVQEGLARMEARLAELAAKV